MLNLLVAGAGKSSIYLIHYLLSHAPRNKWKVIVADADENAALEKIKTNPHGEAVELDITNEAQRQKLVKEADIVFFDAAAPAYIVGEGLPPIQENLITSSYVSPEMKEMDEAVKAAGLMFMCEMGLDPGIDHMTANELILKIHKIPAAVVLFNSYCGGLIAPESDDNPWHYKFSWNPKNILLAGMEGAKYLNQQNQDEVPYEKIFDSSRTVKVDGLGHLAYYPNRDSLKYLDIYDLPDIKTFMRATLRHPDFCLGWQALVKLGLTDNEGCIGDCISYAEWLKQRTGYNNSVSLPEHVASTLQTKADDKVIQMMDWLGLFNEDPIHRTKGASPGLMDLLLAKWQMKPKDKDMVVMMHEVEYAHRKSNIHLTSTMIIKGENREYSAMAKTVGLPMAILGRLILNGKVTPPPGVHIPNMHAVYKPVLTELRHHGIVFHDQIS